MNTNFDSALPAVLVVDDRPENLLAMEHALADLPLEIVCASSGEEAIKHVIRREFALALLDVQMPGLNGFQTASMIKANESSKTLPIIFLTAISRDENHRLKGYECGAVDYLYKPIDVVTLRMKVQVFLTLAEERRKLKSLSQKLAASNDALEAFARTASHDLKAPLRQIRANVQLVAECEGDSLSDIAKNRLLRIEQSAERMTKLVEGLLVYARNGTDPQFTIVPFQQLMSDVLMTLELAISEADVELVVEELPTIEADELMMRQLFLNLMSNAIKYRRKDGNHKVTVTARVDKGRSTCELRFSDNGIGFDNADAAKIFLPFGRLVAPGDFEGSGLGMATVSKILERHGGTIRAEGQKGVGAVFTVTLPLWQSGSKNEPEPQQMPAPSECTAGWVLLVDDDAQDRELFAEVLKSCANSISVIQASHGNEALSALSRQIGAGRLRGWVLSDVNMPIRNGLEFLEMTKQHAEFCEIPFVLWSSEDNDHYRNESERLGASEFRTKPTGLSGLRAAMRELVGRYNKPLA